MVKPHRSWLQKLQEAISHDQQLQSLLDGGVAVPLLVAGAGSLLKSNYLGALLGLGIGIPLVLSMVKTSFANRRLEIFAFVFIGAGFDGLVKLEYRDALLAFLIGVPVASALFIFGSSSVYRRHVSYCYGTYLGPLVARVI